MENGCPTVSIQESGGFSRSEMVSGGNQEFIDYTVENGAIQLKPQHIKLFLRKG